MKYCEHVNDMINNTNVQSCNVKSKIEEVECIKSITEHIYSVFLCFIEQIIYIPRSPFGLNNHKITQLSCANNQSCCNFESFEG